MEERNYKFSFKFKTTRRFIKRAFVIALTAAAFILFAHFTFVEFSIVNILFIFSYLFLKLSTLLLCTYVNILNLDFVTQCMLIHFF